MHFTCREEKSLPKMTIRSSRRTSLELQVTYELPSFTFEVDESLPKHLVLVSSDVHKYLELFLRAQEHLSAMRRN